MSLWSRTAEIAARTPDTRNRLVDFLRAASIVAVISGHWLLAAPYMTEAGLTLANMFKLTSFTKWLSWAFQVMPIFFLVGGYANAVSWRAALRDGKPFAAWLDRRLRRLLLPVLPLIASWILIAILARTAGVGAAIVQEASKGALIPIWFLAIYTVIVLFVPVTHAAWQRWGFVSVLVPVGLAIVDDALFFRGLPALGWLNYVFIWIAVHQLGYAWRDGRIGSPITRLVFGCCELALLYALTVDGPYPVAMISEPGAALSNTLPPKLPLLALATAQAGLILAAEKPLRRWLQRPTPWTIAVMLNGMIMTIYLWHSTAMIAIISLASLLGGPGLAFAPASGAWWLFRPIWLAIYAMALALLMPLVARYERLPEPPRQAAAGRQISGALLACAGLALLAYFGLAGSDPPAVRIIAGAAPFVGAYFGGLLKIGPRKRGANATSGRGG